MMKKVLAVVSLFMVGVIAAVAVAFSIPAKADPFYMNNGQAICQMIDESYSLADILVIHKWVMIDGGFNSEEAAYVIKISVDEYCPWQNAKMAYLIQPQQVA